MNFKSLETIGEIRKKLLLILLIHTESVFQHLTIFNTKIIKKYYLNKIYINLYLIICNFSISCMQNIINYRPFFWPFQGRLKV